MCEDKEHRIRPEQVFIEPELSIVNKCFKPEINDKPSYGYTKSAYWMKFSLTNSDSENIKIVIKLVSLIDDIVLYSFDRNTKNLQLISTTGRNHPLSSRLANHRNFIFRVNVPAQQKRDFLFRFESSGSMLLPITIMSEDRYSNQDHLESLAFGFYFGFMAVMILYNLFLYWSVKDRSYLYYCGYILFFILLQAGIWGFLNQFILPENPYFANKLLPSSILFSVFFSMLFLRNFLGTDKNAPLIDKIIIGIIIFSFCTAVASWVGPYRLMVQIGVFTGMLGSIFIAVSSGVLYLKGYKAARFLFLAFFALILGIFVIGLRNFGFLPFNFATSYSAQIGSALEVLLLSLALGDRINIMKKERELEKEKALLRERNLNESFARFVPSEFLNFLNKEDITRVNLGDAVQKEMTVLFSDIRSFTTISERFSARDNFKYLNLYLEKIGPLIRNNGGFIDKFIGDAVMALFPEKPDDAIRAAREMLLARDEFNNEIVNQGGWPALQIGIGIHYGSLILGTLGESQRMETTVISDAVNVASRVESLTKESASTILTTGETVAALKESKDFVVFKESRRLKGREREVEIWEVN